MYGILHILINQRYYPCLLTILLLLAITLFNSASVCVLNYCLFVCIYLIISKKRNEINQIGHNQEQGLF